MTEVIVPLAQVFVSPEDEDELGWQDQALCAQTDPEAFFPEKGGSTREAKRVCRSCDVRAECLEYALEHDERFGIWGGMSERERCQLKRAAVVRPQPEKAESAPAPARPRSSRFPGVSLKGTRWTARVSRPDGTREYLGSFPREADAARAVTEAEASYQAPQPVKAVA
jgi:WhiB family transcriptional regulator, redox-sensing transcriptional regulator